MLLCMVLILGMIVSVALSRINQTEMAALFSECAAVRGHDGITASDYPAIASSIITYLRSGEEGDIPALRGERLFSERENLHLKDCAGIIRGMMAFRTVFIVLLILGCGAYLLVRTRPDAAKARSLALSAAGCMSMACMAVLGAALVLAAWGLMDFNSLFLTFHRLAFRNDLWLLDPGKDLLIQLMPYSFFVKYAWKILASLLPCLGIMALFPVLYIKFRNASAAS